jgi:Na+(H+)/acetate symporter ActP
MKRQFFALRIISLILKILAVIAFIAFIVGVIFVLISSADFPTLESKVQPLGLALAAGLGGGILLLGVAQLIDLQIALETNTRATTALLQQLGRIMKERL